MHDVQPNGYCRTHNLHIGRCANPVDAPTFKIVAARNVKVGDRIRYSEGCLLRVTEVELGELSTYSPAGRVRHFRGLWVDIDNHSVYRHAVETHEPDALVVLELS